MQDKGLVRDEGLVGSRRGAEKVLRRVSSDQVRDQLWGEIVDHYSPLGLLVLPLQQPYLCLLPALYQTGMWMV